MDKYAESTVRRAASNSQVERAPVGLRVLRDVENNLDVVKPSDNKQIIGPCNRPTRNPRYLMQVFGGSGRAGNVVRIVISRPVSQVRVHRDGPWVDAVGQQLLDLEYDVATCAPGVELKRSRHLFAPGHVLNAKSVKLHEFALHDEYLN